MESNTSSSSSISYDHFLDTVHYIDDFLCAWYITFAVIGIPLNLLLIGVIIFSKQLHLPRNFTWLGIGLSNVCLLAAYIVLTVSIRWGSSSSIRSFCTWLIALSIASQSLIFLIALLDRHIFMIYPKWHMSYVTIGRIMAVQMGSYFSVFLFGNVNLKIFGEFMSNFFCSGSFTMIGTTIIGLFPLLLIGQLIIMKTKTQQHYPSIEVVHVKKNIFPKQKRNREYRKSYFLLINNQQVSPQEVETTKCIFLMGKIYLIFMVPRMILFAMVSLCVLISSAPGSFSESNVADAHCFSFIKVFYYTSAFLCIDSGFVNPLSLLFFSHDLLAVFKSIKCRNPSNHPAVQ